MLNELKELNLIEVAKFAVGIRVQDILISGFCVDNFIFILITFTT
jgi:hypothetical protein